MTPEQILDTMNDRSFKAKYGDLIAMKYNKSDFWYKGRIIEEDNNLVIFVGEGKALRVDRADKVIIMESGPSHDRFGNKVKKVFN